MKTKFELENVADGTRLCDRLDIRNIRGMS